MCFTCRLRCYLSHKGKIDCLRKTVYEILDLMNLHNGMVGGGGTIEIYYLKRHLIRELSGYFVDKHLDEITT